MTESGKYTQAQQLRKRRTVMINEKKLKTDDLTLGLRDVALTRSISERKAMQRDGEIRKLKLAESAHMVLIPFRTTAETRTEIQEAATKLLQRVDKNLEKDGHSKIDSRGRRDQGLSMVTTVMCELMADYVNNSLDEKEYPHQEKLKGFFEDLVIPYLKERRVSRDY